MAEGSPTLEVGFEIQTGGSFGELQRLQAVMDSTEGKLLAAAGAIEKATTGMVGQTATANVVAVGNAATRAGADAARALKTAEAAGEGLSRSMARQIDNFGKTKEEVRAARVEVAALAAAEQGLTELADRLRAQNVQIEAQAQSLRSAAQAYQMFEAAARRGIEAMREAEAAAQSAALAKQEQDLRSAALAYQMFEAAARRGTAAMRDADAAAQSAAMEAQAQELRSAGLAYQMFEAAARQGATAMREADAAAAGDGAALARLRALMDPAAAAQTHLNQELAEATRLMTAAGASTEEIARAHQVLSSRLAATGGSANGQKYAMQNLGFQLQDFSVQVAGGTSALRAFAQQFPQAAGALMGFEGKLGAVGTFLGGGWGIAITLAITVLAGLADAFLKSGEAADTSKKAHDALKESVDRLNGSAAALSHTTRQGTIDDLNAAEATRQLEIRKRGLLDVLLREQQAKLGAARATEGNSGGTVAGAGIVGSGAASVERQVRETNAALAVNAARTAEAANAVVLAKGILIRRDVAAATDTATAATQRYEDASDQLQRKFDKHLITDAQYRTGLTKITQARDAETAAASKSNATHAASDRAAISRAERLGREAEAIGAQTRNLYLLADAYGVSGAAALMAEARVKAESQAIKQQGDVQAAISREIGLVVAQRVSDAAKATASMRDQATVQEQLNAEVAAGNVPAERAQTLLRDRMADLPLLAALEAAQKTQNVVGAQAAADALDQQRAARQRLTDAESAARYVSAMSNGADQLATQREELRLVGATDEARIRALATLRATQEAASQPWSGKDGAAYVAQQVEIAVATERTAAATRNLNDSLSFTADKWDLIARNVQTAAQGMADAFGSVGRAIGDMASVYANYEADRARLTQQHDDAIKKSGGNQQAIDRANQKFALASATSQIGAFGDMAQAAKGFFDEKSKGYQTMLAAEKVFRAVEFALSVKAMAQDAIHTAASVGKSAIRAAASGVEAVAKAIASLPFPANIAAGAATIAALAAIGVSVVGGLGGGSKGTVVKANDGTGTVLGDSSAKSESIKNAIDALKEVDTLTNTFARQMAASLRSIDSQIGNVASLIVRNGDVNASAGVTEGFKTNAIGSVLSKIPLIGGLLGSLFGSTTTVTGSGLYGKSQSVGSILSGGFDAQYYSDIQKKSKFLGITTGTKNSTQYTGADATLENQFTLILKQFNDSIVAAAGPLGSATGEIQNRLNSFVVNIGKIDLKGLTGAEIQEKLSAVFGAAADNMANAAFPGIERFQKVGEGAFETLVRVASTVEAVTNAMDQLGAGARALGIDAKMSLANQFDSLSDLTSAVDGYFQAFYTSEEQAAAKQAQMARVFGSLGFAMPGTLAAFRSLVEAQDLTTAAGQSTYATLLQLAPAFADLQKSMEGAKSAADIASERNDLQRQLLTLQGNTAAIRALDLAKIDSSNRALQEQVWAIQDAQDAAKAADELRAAWTSVGDSIMDEVKRIRGLTGTNGGTSFAALMGQFNAATAAARGGDQDAAKSLPQLSQSLLAAAALVATSRQELDRVQAQTAASLEATNAVVGKLANTVTPASSVASILADAATAQASTTPTASNDDMANELRSLREELVQLRADNNAGHAATASNTGSIKRSFDNVTADSQGTAISVAAAA